ncbi:DUF3862 domain-containing protein [Enterococcus sp. BWT-B8]|uniref:DUF3862 domain-containing protein n=1 Tax=Enterococcus sp. BWT-B8 TaxID=2885157 RepID=UPI001E3B6B81|nr:DUF3862 domain-containing protein [Enterococcus sp. BWT-B8]MCB5952751.1 DUF3862 domain-containing protein [Enterococcus sp. BWT-B8]
MGRKEDRMATAKKPIAKRGWFWLLVFLILGGGGFAASQFIPFDFDLPFGNSASKDSTTEESKTTTENTNTEEDIVEILELYRSINLSDSIAKDVKGSSYDDVVALLGEPSSNVDSEIGETKTKMAIWNTFNGKTTISVNFSDDFAIGKSVAKLVSESDDKTTTDQFEAVPTDGSYTYEQAIEEFGAPDSLSDSLIDNVHATTAFWTTNVEQGFTIHFDNDQAVTKEQVS